MRWLGKDEKLEYVPGSSYYGPSHYRPFWGYYGYAAPLMYDPGYFTSTERHRMETNIFNLAEDKIIWTGHSETADPTSLDDLVDSVARAVGDELVKQGLVK